MGRGERGGEWEMDSERFNNVCHKINFNFKRLN